MLLPCGLRSLWAWVVLRLCHSSRCWVCGLCLSLRVCSLVICWVTTCFDVRMDCRFARCGIPCILFLFCFGAATWYLRVVLIKLWLQRQTAGPVFAFFPWWCRSWSRAVGWATWVEWADCQWVVVHVLYLGFDLCVVCSARFLHVGGLVKKIGFCEPGPGWPSLLPPTLTLIIWLSPNIHLRVVLSWVVCRWPYKKKY